MEQKEKPGKAKDEKDEVKEAFEKSQARFAGAPREKREVEGADISRHKPEPAATGMRAGREKPDEAPVAAELPPAPSPYLAEHTVVAGDNLSYISKQYYGTADKYMKIYEANKEVIGSNPSVIRAGQVLKIPRLD